MSFSKASAIDSGAVMSRAWITGSAGDGTCGRSYKGASSPSSLIGRSTMVSPLCLTTKRMVGVV